MLKWYYEVGVFMLINSKEIGKNLKKIRIEKGLSQEQLAKKINYTRQNISKWENGISFPADDIIINKLSTILEISKEELLNFQKEKDILKNKKNIYYWLFGLLIILLLVLGIICYFILNQKIYKINIDGIFSGVYTSNFRERYLNLYTNGYIENLKGLYLYTVYNNEEKYILKTAENDINVYEKGDSYEYNLRYVFKCGLHLVLFYQDETYDKYDYYLNNDKADDTCDYEYVYKNNSVLENYGFVKDGFSYIYTFDNTKLIYNGYGYHLDLIDNETIESVETLGEFHFLYEKYNKSTGNQQDEIIEIKEEKDCIEEKCATYEDYAKFINFLTNVNR